MRIAKPMLLVAVPIGVVTGIYAAYRTMGGLVVLLVALLSMITVAFLTVVFTVRREHAQERAAREAAASAAASGEKPGPSAVEPITPKEHGIPGRDRA